MTKILVICSGYPTKSHPYRNIYIKEQIEAIQKIDPRFKFEIFQVNPNRKKINYLKALFKLDSIARLQKFDLFHAHFGLSALTSIWQNRIPVIVSYHGCDINAKYNRLYSKWLIKHRVVFSIFVNRRQVELMKNPKNFAIIPCGVCLNSFYPIEMKFAKSKLGWKHNKKYILFSSQFKRIEKNSDLAKEAIARLNNNCLRLIELKNYTRKEINYLLNAADLLLMTSIREGSPQIVKEAMACNLPIVSTDVGDVKKIIGNTEGCYITSFDSKDVAEKIKMALDFAKRTTGRENIGYLEISNIARKVISVYERVVERI